MSALKLSALSFFRTHRDVRCLEHDHTSSNHKSRIVTRTTARVAQITKKKNSDGVVPPATTNALLDISKNKAKRAGISEMWILWSTLIFRSCVILKSRVLWAWVIVPYA